MVECLPRQAGSPGFDPITRERKEGKKKGKEGLKEGGRDGEGDSEQSSRRRPPPRGLEMPR